MRSALLLLLSGLAPSARPSSEPVQVELSALRKDPAPHLGTEVRCTVQFHRALEDWEPFLSRFEPRAWLAIEAWPDESFVWEAAVFDDPATRIFVRRGSAGAKLLGAARTYARFEIRARVSELFLGEPWLEVLEATPLAGEVGEGTILHLSRARGLAAYEQWDLALEQYERAKAGPLPMHALGAIEREILEVLEARRASEKKDPRPERTVRTPGASG